MAKKGKKAGAESINSKLQLVMKSGKVSLGHKSTVKSIRSGKGRTLSLYVVGACSQPSRTFRHVYVCVI